MREKARNILQINRILSFQLIKISTSKKWLLPTLFFCIAYILCVLATTISFYLEGIAQRNVAFLVFLLLQFCLFAICILYVLHIQRQKEYVVRTRYSIIFLAIGITMLLTACIYIFTSAGLSNDINLYADYGRILWIYHANPYLTPPSAFPHDPLFSSVYWKNTVTIYGPIWTLACAFLVSFSGTNPINIFITFRIFASILHFINTYVIYAILRTQDYPRRIILIGTLLYALNPLVLFESSTGGHIDVLMTTFVLSGVLCAVRAEKKGDFRLTRYIPALVAFTLAVLVKFTIIPVLILFIVMLFFKVSSSTRIKRLPIGERWRIILLNMLLISTVCVGVFLLFYGPFWFGHSFKSIMYIFSSQPEATGSFTSLLSALQIWNTFHPLPAAFIPITNLHFWNIIIYSTMGLVLLSGGLRLRQNPTIQKAIFVSLAVMAVFLLMTNWFLAWYVICPLAIAVVCLPTAGRYSRYTGRLGHGLLAFTFTLSFSAFLTYYFNFVGSYNLHSHPQRITWLIVCYVATFTIPTLAFLIFFSKGVKDLFRRNNDRIHP